MGKPLKAKQLNLSKGQRDRVLKWQGVKVSKRIRLGHTGHFGKVDVVPIEGKPKKIKHDINEEPVAPDIVAPNLKGKLPGESYAKFLKRVGKETRDALVQLNTSKRTVSAKRKAYLDSRKEIVKGKKVQIQRAQILDKVKRQEGSAADLRLDDDVALEETVKKSLSSFDTQYVNFGEQAERPPQIKISKPLKGLKKQPDSKFGFVQGGVPAIPELSGHERNRREFEILRQNAVRSYREMVAKKREKKGLGSL
jgi:hypothetical protein